MKTIEASIIFPFTLVVMVLIMFLSFNLHDMILYKAATYKYLICNGPNSFDYNISSDYNLTPLSSYIYDYSLTNNSVNLSKDNHSIKIVSDNYISTIDCQYYDKCDLLRKCVVADELLKTITNQ